MGKPDEFFLPEKSVTKRAAVCFAIFSPFVPVISENVTKYMRPTSFQIIRSLTI